MIKEMKRIYNYIAVFLVISILAILFFYVQSMEHKTNVVDETAYTLQVVEKEGLWIYEIYNGNSLFIRQEYIPAVKGQQVFKSKRDAEKIGNLVVSKLSRHKVPVISVNDLNNNKIRFEKI